MLNVGKHFVDTKHLTSMKVLTDLINLTYLPDITFPKNSITRIAFSSGSITKRGVNMVGTC